MTDDWRRLRKAFKALSKRAKRPLRGFHRADGLGRSERSVLARLDASEADAQYLQPIRGQLEAAASAPPWYLDGDVSTVREFKVLADRGAALLGHIGRDAWSFWLDRLLSAPIESSRLVSEADGMPSTLIRDAVETSIALCIQLEAGASATTASVLTSIALSGTPRQRVDAFIQQATRIHGRRVSRMHIWRNAGYTSRTEFERWQRQDPRATPTAAANIERVLADPAGLRIDAR